MATGKLALAVIHGVGSQGPDFADGIISELKEQFADGIPRNQRHGLSQQRLRDELVALLVYWAPVLPMEQELYNRIQASHDLDWTRLRRFFIGLMGDGIAYQPLPGGKYDFYYQIHQVLADTLGELAEATGPSAPLTIIGHSLGTVIASNFIWDATHGNTMLPVTSGESSLSKCETLTNFYTLGSPLATWSLRYPDFGEPITIPSLKQTALPGEWINFFDNDDIISYPLQSLNAKYAAAVRDQEVNVGGWLSSWNPVSHSEYWSNNDVSVPIARKLSQDWMTINP
jgi:hypothetical protein